MGVIMESPQAISPVLQQLQQMGALATTPSPQQSVGREIERTNRESAVSGMNINKAYKDAADATQKLGEVQSQQMAQAAQLQQQYLAEQERIAADHQYRQMERQKAAQIAIDEVNNAIQERKNKNIDPNRLWSNASTGEKARAMVGVFLGALGQGLMGSNRNAVLDALNAQIDADINTQKEEISGADKYIEDAKNLYQLNLQQSKDEDEAYLRTRVMLRENYLDKVSQIELTSQSQQKVQQAQIAKSELMRQQEADLQNIANLRANRVDRLMASQSDMQAQEMAAQQPSQKMIDDAIQQEKTDVPGLKRVKRVTDTDSQKVKELKGTYDTLIDIADEIESLRKESTLNGFTGTEGKRLSDGWNAVMTLALKDYKEMGASFTEMEKSMVDAMSAPSATNLKNFDAAMKRFRRQMKIELKNKIKPYGYVDESIDTEEKTAEEAKKLGGTMVR